MTSSNAGRAQKLLVTLKTAMDFAGTLPAKASVKIRPQDWHNLIDQATEAASILHQQEERIEALMRERASLIDTKREQIERLTAELKNCGAALAEEVEFRLGVEARVKVLEEALEFVRRWAIDKEGNGTSAEERLSAIANHPGIARTALQQTKKEGK